jgi:uncharacterized membrane protein
MAENTQGDKMHKVEADVELDVPISRAYDQWTQFEEFPRFMEGVESVTQVDDTHLHWVAEVAGKRLAWDAEIVEQEPDRIISWKSTSGPVNNGAVVFEVLEPGRCRISLTMTYAPETFTEKVGSALGVVTARVKADLKRFKEFIEGRAVPTGSWRGEVHDGQKGAQPMGQTGMTPADALQNRRRD